MALIKDTTYNKIINEAEKHLTIINEMVDISDKYNKLITSRFINHEKYNVFDEMQKVTDKHQKLQTDKDETFNNVCIYLQEYLKIHKQVTLQQLENSFREDEENIYLIATQNDKTYKFRGEEKEYCLNIIITLPEYLEEEIKQLGLHKDLNNAGFKVITKMDLEEMI
ncbi:MAG: hypothetical protein CMF62_04165 [Magnetococcales bacterium]|nr:hypothetical protein [Magnetococcales bacterium]